MDAELKSLMELAGRHGERGQELFDTCNSELFPCDALAFAVLERSLNLLKSFNLLLSNGGYTTGVALLRMQLDNVLRFYGVTISGDPHDIANKIFHGQELRKLKDSAGEKMTDARLVELLSVTNPGVKQIYALACSYVHLSDQHLLHFLHRSKKNPDGKRDFAIGDEDEYVEAEYKIRLINAFAVVTRGTLELIKQWTVRRHTYGTNEQLKARFSMAI